MSLRTTYSITCPCGRTGELVLKENDQPFSGEWKKYSITHFIGESYSTTDHVPLTKVLQHMNATCPQCNRKVLADYINS
jgi:hypothetical protein